VADLICQVIQHANSNLPEDRRVNVLAFRDVVGATEYDELAGDLADIYQPFLTNVGTDCASVEVRVYNKADAEPREALGSASRAVGVSPGGMPYEVACCLSFYSDRNLPRNRGRIFLGPFNGSLTSDRPGALRQEILDLATDFANLGGVNIQWCVWSRRDNAFKQVSNAWVDNAWDTIRSRGLKPTSRLTVAVEG
jgi:hypothetical protein